jgi:type IV pilus biogenesis protein CpaD/CtpE
MNRRSVLLALLAIPLLEACASVDAQQTTTVNAVVETVDPVSRELLLRGNSGSQSGFLMSMIVGSHVQRLNEIRAGDRVTVTYYQGLAAKVVSPLSGSSEPFAGVAIERNDVAQRPGGEVTRVRSGRVTITAVDPATGTISFVGPNNLPRTVVPKNPEVLDFVRRLRVGQQVDVVYEEALAISVEPMK